MEFLGIEFLQGTFDYFHGSAFFPPAEAFQAPWKRVETLEPQLSCVARKNLMEKDLAQRSFSLLRDENGN